MDSETALQIGLALAMLAVLIVVLWPKLACDSSQGQQSCAPKIPSAADPDDTTKVQLSRPRGSHRVSHRYDPLFRLRLNTPSPPAEDHPDDKTAA